MPAKRKHNGIEPGIMPKNIMKVPLTRKEWGEFADRQDAMDATAGYAAAEAIRGWLKGGGK